MWDETSRWRGFAFELVTCPAYHAFWTFHKTDVVTLLAQSAAHLAGTATPNSRKCAPKGLFASSSRKLVGASVHQPFEILKQYKVLFQAPYGLMGHDRRMQRSMLLFMLFRNTYQVGYFSQRLLQSAAAEMGVWRFTRSRKIEHIVADIIQLKIQCHYWPVVQKEHIIRGKCES